MYKHTHIITTFLLLIASFSSFAEDTLFRTNGDTLICKILDEKEDRIHFITKRNKKKVESFLKSTEVKGISYDRTINRNLLKIEKGTVGVGLGLEFGGMTGFNFVSYFNPYVGFMIGGGLFYKNKPGVCVGGKFRLANAYAGYVVPYVQAFYGTNVVVEYTSYDLFSLQKTYETFMGLSYGTGIDIYLNRKKNQLMTVAFNIPKYSEAAKEKIIRTEQLSVVTSIGYKVAF